MLGLIRRGGWRLLAALLVVAMAATPADADRKRKPGRKKRKNKTKVTKVEAPKPAPAPTSAPTAPAAAPAPAAKPAPAPAPAAETESKEAPAKTDDTTKTTTSNLSFDDLMGSLSKGGINPSSVVIVEDDFVAMAAPSDKTMTDAYGTVTSDLRSLEVMKVQKAQARATGSGVVVAVLDGGFNTKHPVIAANMSAYGFDAIDGDGDPNDFGNGIDDDRDGRVDNALGHGTFVSGMILQVAPDATIVPIRVRDDEGFGTNTELERGIAYAIDLGVDVINLSVDSALLDFYTAMKAVDKARAAGIIVVVSAGNEGSIWLSGIANTKDTIIVGSVDNDGRIAKFSNYASDWTRDDTLMIFAPGVDLCGPVGLREVGCWSGTSFSTGYISGAVALLLQNNPDYDPTMVRFALAEATTPVTFMDGTPYHRGGQINLAKVAAR